MATLTQEAAERLIKARQKEFLSWAEAEACLASLGPQERGALRRRIFRATFDAFRLGVVGLEGLNEEVLWRYFFTWAELKPLPPAAREEVMRKCFQVTLDAFRVGALVSAGTSGSTGGAHAL